MRRARAELHLRTLAAWRTSWQPTLVFFCQARVVRLQLLLLMVAFTSQKAHAGDIVSVSTTVECSGTGFLAVQASTGRLFTICNSGLLAGVVAFEGVAGRNVLSASECAVPLGIAINDHTDTVFVACRVDANGADGHILALRSTLLGTMQVVAVRNISSLLSVHWSPYSGLLYVITETDILAASTAVDGSISALVSIIPHGQICQQPSNMHVSSASSNATGDVLVAQCGGPDNDAFLRDVIVIDLTVGIEPADAWIPLLVGPAGCHFIQGLTMDPAGTVYVACDIEIVFNPPPDPPPDPPGEVLALSPSMQGIRRQQGRRGHSRLDPALVRAELVGFSLCAQSSNVVYSPATNYLYVACPESLQRLLLVDGATLEVVFTWAQFGTPITALMVAHRQGLDTLYVRDDTAGIQVVLTAGTFAPPGMVGKPVIPGDGPDDFFRLRNVVISPDGRMWNLVTSNSVLSTRDPGNPDAPDVSLALVPALATAVQSLIATRNNRLYISINDSPEVWLAVASDSAITMSVLFTTSVRPNSPSLADAGSTLALSLDGTRLYVVRMNPFANSELDQVLLLTQLTNSSTVTAVVAVSSLPSAMADQSCRDSAISADGRALFIRCGNTLTVPLNSAGSAVTDPPITVVIPWSDCFGNRVALQVAPAEVANMVYAVCFRSVIALNITSSTYEKIADFSGVGCFAVAMAVRKNTAYGWCAPGVTSSYQNRISPVTASSGRPWLNPLDETLYVSEHVPGSLARVVSFECGYVPGLFLRDDSCRPCSVGSSRSLLNATLTASLPDRDLCQACKDGYIAVSSGQGYCDACPLGFFSKPKRGVLATTCFPCSPGTASGPTVGSSSCKLCRNGTVAAEQELSQCESCRPGYYATGEGNVRCIECSQVLAVVLNSGCSIFVEFSFPD